MVRHGMPYFVPEEREAARAALRSRRTKVLLVLLVLVGLAAGVPSAFVSGDASLAPATVMLLLGVAALVYGLTALRARPIATWAVARTLGSLRQLLPLATRALPLLLIFVTFLFINAEVWQVSATLDGGLLWITVMLFALVAAVFLLVRLPEELDGIHDLGRDELVEACRHTPLEGRVEEVVAQTDPAELHALTRVAGFERANLLLVLVIAQAVQVLLLSLLVFGFFLLFGALVMDEVVQEAWIQDSTTGVSWLPHLTVELVQVSVFLAAFSGLYFTVYAVTDESYRDQFFVEVRRELDRAVGVRAVYTAVRRRSP
ncbi:hypothetical protein H9L09_17190 [Nocardioides mesophilus]|uniref:Integral membrane protein n=1 Tax=Nocardioides mesophilus TaxID=433659 RepID=A0A7G9RHQ0_9ACTN|nr:hypothetical protein H9L09_17190 [Nocardioides mesophilus]